MTQGQGCVKLADRGSLGVPRCIRVCVCVCVCVCAWSGTSSLTRWYRVGADTENPSQAMYNSETPTLWQP